MSWKRQHYRRSLQSLLISSLTGSVVTCFSGILWVILKLSGDQGGATVSRIITLLAATVTLLSISGLVLILTRLQLLRLDGQEPSANNKTGPDA